MRRGIVPASMARFVESRNRPAEVPKSPVPVAAPELTTRAGFPAPDVDGLSLLWREVAAIPTVKRAYFSHPQYASVQFETIDLENGKRPVQERTVLLSSATLLPATTAVAEEGFKPVYPSPSRKRTLRFAKVGDDWFAEVYEDGLLLAKVAAGTTHGAPLMDGAMQSPSWSDDENTVVFVAEKPRKKAAPVWKPTGKEPLDADRGAFEYRETWGEQFADCSVTTLVLLDVADRKSRDLLAADFSMQYSAASPCLTHDGSRVTFVGYAHLPRRLGIVYCASRATNLFSMAVNATGDPTTPVDRTFCRNIRCLTRHPTDDRIAAVVADETSQAHCTCSSLVVMSAETVRDLSKGPMPITTLVPIVSTAARDEFPGLYVNVNSEVAWVSPRHVLVNSARRSENVFYLVDVEKPGREACTAAAAAVRRGPAGLGTLKLLDTFGSQVLATFSTTAQPWNLMYTPDICAADVDWRLVMPSGLLMPESIRAAVTERPLSSALVYPEASLHQTESIWHGVKDG
jgi:hypothetical protein